VSNRLVKAPMTERLCVFDRETEVDHGKPNKALFRYASLSHLFTYTFTIVLLHHMRISTASTFPAWSLNKLFKFIMPKF
jgi:hypothetical protein